MTQWELPAALLTLFILYCPSSGVSLKLSNDDLIGRSESVYINDWSNHKDAQTYTIDLTPIDLQTSQSNRQHILDRFEKRSNRKPNSRRHRHRRRKKRRRQKFKKKAHKYHFSRKFSGQTLLVNPVTVTGLREIPELPYDVNRELEKEELLKNKSQAALKTGEESLEMKANILGSSIEPQTTRANDQQLPGDYEREEEKPTRPHINSDKVNWLDDQDDKTITERLNENEGIYSKFMTWISFGQNKQENVFEAPATVNLRDTLSEDEQQIDAWREAEPEEPVTLEWSEWSVCSASCGQGVSKRRRSCGYNCVETASEPCWDSNCTATAASTDGTTLKNGTVPKKLQDLLDVLVRILKQEIITFKNSRSSKGDMCSRWQSCQAENVLRHLARISSLPSCPCHYPEGLLIDDRIWDKKLEKTYRWRNDGNSRTHMDVYRKGATYCIHSEIDQTVSAQQCCYDNDKRLITRGWGAGSPMVISYQASKKLHKTVDVLPWISCKGDFNRYHKLRPPNNGNKCQANPNKKEFQRQMKMAAYF